MKAVCAWCGEDLGYERKVGDEPESCGSRECEKEIRRLLQEEEAELRERAEYDRYQRYR